MLQVIDLKKNYNTVEALRGVTLDISDGEFISIMGKSGCGKTTLLHCMSGILKPSSGEILFDEKSLFKIKDRARSKVRRTSMGFVFQFFNLVPELTVRENILLPLKINRYKVDEVYFDKLIEDLGIIEQIDRLPATLSGGQQQRVAIARALIHKPKIVFADEPSGNLDETSSREVIELLQSLQKEYNLDCLKIASNLAKIMKLISNLW
jgi:putative ABC transport system ATP-binding protein